MRLGPATYGSTPSRLAAWLLPIAVAMTVAGCEPTRARRRSVVLVTIDTQRADHLGLYGHDRPTSPTVDRIAAESTVFDRALVTCPATGPSIASILTGRHRATHGVTRNGRPLRPEVETLAEILRRSGFRTAAVISNPVVDKRGFDQGFEAFGMAPRLNRFGPGMFEGAAVVKRARRLLEDLGDEPYFLWVHLMDPHGPYYPPARYRERFPPRWYRRPGENPLAVTRRNYGYDLIPSYQHVRGRRDPASYRARYDAEIRYTDDLVAALVRLLRARGDWDDTIFVLTADHGESLGEHRVYFQHGWQAYDGSLRVPLLIRAPGLVPAGQRVAASVSLIDLVPTILDLLDVPSPPATEGRSLRPLMRGSGSDRPAFAQTYYGNRLVVLQRGRWKYIWTPPPRVRRPGRPPAQRSSDGWKAHWPTEQREELYDLAADPDETNDLSAERPGIRRRFARKARRWLQRQQVHAQRRIAAERKIAAEPKKGAGPARKPPSSPQLEKQLRALGYLD